jgi:putative ABC transport system permease protein
MFKNYLRIAIRNLWRTKEFSLINVTGLAIGMASAALIMFWIQNELSYDRFHKNKDHLYEVWNRAIFDGKLQCWDNTPDVLGPTLKNEFPEIAEVTRTNYQWFLTSANEKKFMSRSLMVDPSFLSMFSFPLLHGNPKTALIDLYSIVITEKLAKKMFGNEEAMNKTIRLERENFKVTGILKDLPVNTRFDFEYLLPWAYMVKLGEGGILKMVEYVELTLVIFFLQYGLLLAGVLPWLTGSFIIAASGLFFWRYYLYESKY